MAEDQNLPSTLQNPRDVLPVRDPRDSRDNYMTIYDEHGVAHRKPRIVARECLQQKTGVGRNVWTRDPQVAAARREAKTKVLSKNSPSPPAPPPPAPPPEGDKLPEDDKLLEAAATAKTGAAPDKKK